jgi:hypothetical protein
MMMMKDVGGVTMAESSNVRRQALVGSREEERSCWRFANAAEKEPFGTVRLQTVREGAVP